MILYEGAEQCGNSLYLKYSHSDEGIAINIKLESIARVIVQQNSITNTGKETVNLTSLPSEFIDFVAHSAETPWYKKDIRLNLCHSKWQSA